MTMKTTIALLLTTLFAAPLLAADAADEIKAAALKLADQPKYSWVAKTDSATPTNSNANAGGEAGGRGGRGGRGGGGGFNPPEGKTEKGGFTLLTYKMGETTTEAVRKGDKVAVKDGDEWKTSEELSEGADATAQGGRGNRAQGLARRVQQAKLPTAEAQDLIGKVKGLKKDGDTYTGELTAEAIKEMYTFRGRPGGQGGGDANAPVTTGLKGTAKFWVKDGVLSKYESHVEGKMTGGRQNRETEVNRKTTVEIKDVGTTKVTVPEEAKKKLS